MSLIVSNNSFRLYNIRNKINIHNIQPDFHLLHIKQPQLKDIIKTYAEIANIPNDNIRCKVKRLKYEELNSEWSDVQINSGIICISRENIQGGYAEIQGDSTICLEPGNMVLIKEKTKMRLTSLMPLDTKYPSYFDIITLTIREDFDDVSDTSHM